MKRFGAWLKKIILAFVMKDGEVSKSAIFLSLYLVAFLGLWIFMSLFAGVTFLGWWLVPEFNVAAAVAVVSPVITLYLFNHKIPSPNQRKALEEAKVTTKKITEVIDPSEEDE